MSLQLVTVLINIGLAVLKFVVGTLAGSRALIADAFNSAGDVIATGVAWLAFRWGAMPPDENHHYGHGNAEALAGLLIGGMLCATGGFILVEGILAGASASIAPPPDASAVWAAAATGVVKEALYRASIRVGRRTGSPTLLAAARDHRADVVTSAAALVGIVVARSGFPAVDTVAAIAIGCYIFYLGFAPVRENLGILMHEAPPELSQRAAEVALGVAGVRGVRTVRVHPIGGQYRIDMVLAVAGEWTVDRAHELAHDVEESVLRGLDGLTEVYVHVEPADAPTH